MSDGITSRLATVIGISFTVNLASTDATLILTGTPDLSINIATKNLVAGENCIIEGYGISFPYQFGQGEMDSIGPMFIQVGWQDSSGNNGSVNELGDTGRLNIPDPNYWYEANTFVPFPSTADSKWFFEIVGLGGSVSMINVPSVFDAADLSAQFHMKIKHTTQLIA